MTSPVNVGDVLAGKYRIERILGEGGMGVVVAAMHLDLQELRAIKFMLPAFLGDARAVERFLREARAASRLRSEHVAKVHDVGRFDNGAPYMVMEYLEGGDLGAYAKHRGAIPVGEAALYGLQACEGLAEAHAAGIVHRDLKLANLFITWRADGFPCIKVLDFGVSKNLAVTGDLEMTNTATTLGSPNYMSPEQMRSARSVDARTDIWSLGVILFRLTTGHLPFRAENATELIAMVLTTPPPPPSQVRSGIPPEFDAVVLKCLERDLARRYPSVQALMADLGRFVVAPVVVQTAGAAPPVGWSPPGAHGGEAPSSGSAPSVSFPTVEQSYRSVGPAPEGAASPPASLGAAAARGAAAGPSSRSLVLASLAGVALAALAAIAVFALRGGARPGENASTPAAAARPAPPVSTASAAPVAASASAEASPPELPALAAPSASASAAPSAAESASLVAAGASAKPPPVAVASAAVAPKPAGAPKSTPPGPAAESDPFGRARK